MNFTHCNLLQVIYRGRVQSLPVGRLVLKDRRIYFEYAESFLRTNLPLSPFKLPLKQGVHECRDPIFERLHGVFADSLPDGWGRLLLDRTVRSFNIAPESLTPLDRLAFVGSYGMGALAFLPEIPLQQTPPTEMPLDMMAEHAARVLHDTAVPDDLAIHLHTLAGSSGGARPKILCNVAADHTITSLGSRTDPVQSRPWIIKFLSPYDDHESGAVEYAYHQMAKDAGLTVPNSHLFGSTKTLGYFGCERFDRGEDNLPIHMHSACGLLHADYRLPALDYDTLLRATLHLTKNMEEVVAMFRIAAFNVIAHNRDDHSRNFAFLMDSTGRWSVAPAFDLTFSGGMGGEHATMVAGEGKHPSGAHLKRLATQVGIQPNRASAIVQQIKQVVAEWPSYASVNNISHKTTEHITRGLRRVNSDLS